MIKIFTQDDLLRYLYQETSVAENKDIANALLCDTDLLDLYKQLASVKRDLDHAVKIPSRRVINNILEYSRSFKLYSV